MFADDSSAHASSQGSRLPRVSPALPASPLSIVLRTSVLVTPMHLRQPQRELPSRPGVVASHLPRSPTMPRASFGELALFCTGKQLPLEVLNSAAGHYIGTRDTEGPVSRESREYFRSFAAAERALARGGWSQLAIP